MEIIFRLPGLSDAARLFLESIPGRRVIALHGEMGAGKTTFCAALCRAMGVAETVNSPTFSLVNEYHTLSGDILHHMDWYRLKDEEEALQAGMEEYLYSGSVCLVEWPERAPGLLPPDTVHVYLGVIDPQTRRLRIGSF